MDFSFFLMGGGFRELQREHNSRTGGAVSWCGFVLACKYYATAKLHKIQEAGLNFFLCVFFSLSVLLVKTGGRDGI